MMRVPIQTLIVVCWTLLTLACGSDSTAPHDEQQNLMQLRLRVRAITLSVVAPFDTIQLVADAYRGDGSLMTDVFPIFQSAEGGISVTPDGFITAGLVRPDPYAVTVHLSHNGITVADTAYVLVTNVVDPSPVTELTLNIPPLVADPATNTVAEVVVRDSAGAELWVPIDFRSSNTGVATVDMEGAIIGHLPDRPVTISARTTVYGRTLMQSMDVIVGYPARLVLGLRPKSRLPDEVGYQFLLSHVYVARGGYIVFFNGVGNSPIFDQEVDVIFSDPSVATRASFPQPFPTGDGNIAPFGAKDMTTFLSAFQLREFHTPGTYTFYSERLQSGGTIHVR